MKSPFLVCAACFAFGILASCEDASSSNARDVVLDTNSCGVPWNSSVAYGALADSRDGQVYRTVKIGSQTWMAQNLNYAVDSSWCYENATDSCRKYGRLYQWASAMGLGVGFDAQLWNGTLPRQGACPLGWHLPGSTEWSALVQAVDSATSSIKLKSASGWWVDAGTDVYGFRALPAGDRQSDGMFYTRGVFGHFWSASEIDASVASLRYISYATDDVYLNAADKVMSYSIRCLKD